MGLRWQKALTCVCCLLRGAPLSRSGLWRKLSLAAILCALFILFYYNHIIITSSSTRLTSSQNFLVSVSSLQSFTEISKNSQVDRGQNKKPAVINLSHGNKADSSLTHSSSPPPSLAGLTPAPDQTSRAVSNEPLADRPTRERESKAVKSRERSRYFTERSVLPQVLLLYGADSYKPSTEVRIFLEAHRIPFHCTNLEKGRHLLSEANGVSNNSRSSRDPTREISLVVIVSDFHSNSVEPYLDFCRQRTLPLIWVVVPAESNSNNPKPHVSNLHTASLESSAISRVTLSHSYPFYYGRPGASGDDIPPDSLWTTFSHEGSHDGHMTNLHPPHNAQVTTTTQESMRENERESAASDTDYRTLVAVYAASNTTAGASPVVVEDSGRRDGVRKVLVWTPVQSWLTHLALLEAVHQVCGEMVREGRESLVMVDIDDVFLAPDERRMTRDDVKVCVCV